MSEAYGRRKGGRLSTSIMMVERCDLQTPLPPGEDVERSETGEGL